MFLVCFGLSWLVGFGLLVGWLLLFMGCLWDVYGFKMFAILFAMVSDGSQWCC